MTEGEEQYKSQTHLTTVIRMGSITHCVYKLLKQNLYVQGCLLIDCLLTRGVRPGSQAAQVSILLPLVAQMPLSLFLHFTVGIIVVPPSELLGELKELICVKYFEKYLAHNKQSLLVTIKMMVSISVCFLSACFFISH